MTVYREIKEINKMEMLLKFGRNCSVLLSYLHVLESARMKAGRMSALVQK
jgi:hypothetical protein